jgi:hypothetical protein
MELDVTDIKKWKVIFLHRKQHFALRNRHILVCNENYIIFEIPNSQMTEHGIRKYITIYRYS